MATSAPVWEGHNIYFSSDDETDVDNGVDSNKKQKISQNTKVVDIEDNEIKPTTNEYVIWLLSLHCLTITGKKYLLWLARFRQRRCSAL